MTRREGNRTVTRQETYWHPIITDVQAVPAAVQDKTGEALIDLKAAELTIAAMQGRSGTFKSLPANVERNLQKRYGVSSKGLIFNKSMRYTESVLEQGAKVFVVGDCKVKKGGTASFYRGDDPLLVTDRNEEQLVGHYKTRFYGFTAGAILAPTIITAIAGFVGFEMYKHQAALHLPNANQQQPAPQVPQQGGQPQAAAPEKADPIAAVLTQLQDPDFKKRGEAAKKLADLPVDEARHEDVARALNPLLEGTNDHARDQAMRAIIKGWGTADNEEALKKLLTHKNANVRKEAQQALDKLPK